MRAPLTYDTYRVKMRLASVYTILEISPHTPPDAETAIACLAAGLFILRHVDADEGRALEAARKVARRVAAYLPGPPAELPPEPRDRDTT